MMAVMICGPATITTASGKTFSKLSIRDPRPAVVCCRWGGRGGTRHEALVEISRCLLRKRKTSPWGEDVNPRARPQQRNLPGDSSVEGDAPRRSSVLAGRTDPGLTARFHHDRKGAAA